MEGGEDMGYFYFSSQILNRASHSAVAAAAYRSGETLYSERDGLTKNYGERIVQPQCFILKPKHAPDWVMDRERLWNEVEKIEKQKNAQMVREIRLALPTVLSEEDQKELLLEFCKKNFSDEGMVADIAIHRDKEKNPHAHVMLTMRPFNEDGSWGNKRKKINQEVSGVIKKVSVHLTDWNEKETLSRWRKNYAEIINEKLNIRGIDDQVSHESYKKQGLDRIPEIRLERTAYRYEMQLKDKAARNKTLYEPATFYGKINEEIRQLNAQLGKLSDDRRKQVISISEYQNEKTLKEQIKLVRTSRQLSVEEKSALQMVAQRSKSYVDFRIAKHIKDEIEQGSWKKKIESDRVKILSEKNLLSKAYKAFQEDPKQVLKFGFTPTHFLAQMKNKVTSIKVMEQKNSEDLRKYSLLLDKSVKALEVQRELTEKEFLVLYQVNYKIPVDEMYHAVQYFKDTSQVLNKEEISKYAKSKGNEIHKNVPSLSDQTKNISKSIFILDRAIQKQRKVILNSLQEQKYDLVYEANKKVEQYKLQRERHEKDLAGNVGLIKVELQSHYSDSLESIKNAELILQLKDRHEKGLSTGRVDQDLHLIISKFEKENANTSDQTLTPEKQIEKAYSQHIVSGLLQVLDQVERANKNKKRGKDPTEKKQRRRYRGQHLDH